MCCVTAKVEFHDWGNLFMFMFFMLLWDFLSVLKLVISGGICVGEQARG